MNLENLFQIKDNSDNWKNKFSSYFLEEYFYVDRSSVIGPDKNEYISIYTNNIDINEKDKGSNIIDIALNLGLGIVINKNKEIPDLVLNYANLWSIKLTGSIIGNEQFSLRENERNFDGDIKIMIGRGSDKILPDNIREVIADKLTKVYKIQKPNIQFIQYQNGFYKYGLFIPLDNIKDNNIEKFFDWHIPFFFGIRVS